MNDEHAREPQTLRIVRESLSGETREFAEIRSSRAAEPAPAAESAEIESSTFTCPRCGTPIPVERLRELREEGSRPYFCPGDWNGQT